MDRVFPWERLFCGESEFEKGRRHEVDPVGHPGGMPGKDRERPQERDLKQTGARDGSGDPECGEIHFYQFACRKACAKTGNKPGVTKGKQWIRLNKNVELLDTPGILWPKFEDQEVGLKLAFIGSIKDEILQTEELAAELIKFLSAGYPGVLEEKYSIPAVGDAYECLKDIAESRHCLVRGSELDTEKAASILLDDFRGGKLGRITLERPET